MIGMELWWLGQSGFRLRDPDTNLTLFVDPYLSPHDGRTWQAPVKAEALANADLILCTHEHIDHFDRPALQAANATPGARFLLVVPQPIVEMARAFGIPSERILGAQPGQTLELMGARIHPVPACHGVNVADAYNFGKELSGGLVRYLGYVVEFGGVRAYHAGDTIPYAGQIETLRRLKPDLALLPINGRDYFREKDLNIVGNMEPREAARVASDIGAQVLIPMHWDIFPFNRGFPREVVAYVDEFLPWLTVLVMGRAAQLVYSPLGEHWNAVT
jgi:L-ascorbate metabolism protein UlaG (beta-lactamase superfamily)